MNKKPRQKFKYLEKEKSFQGEIKTVFHHLRAFIEANKKFFLGGESLTLRLFQSSFSEFYVKILDKHR